MKRLIKKKDNREDEGGMAEVFQFLDIELASCMCQGIWIENASQGVIQWNASEDAVHCHSLCSPGTRKI
jgi:hypothetical protein